MNARYLRGALVGAGHVSQFHMLAWQQIPQVEILGVIDPDLQRAQDRASEFGLNRVYTSLPDFLRDTSDLDFIDIAAPPESHLDLVAQAAAHGVHILCQKPFAPSLADARQMIEICRAAGVCLSVNENWRWRPWYRKIKVILESGILGKTVYASYFVHGSGWLPGPEWHASHRFAHWPRVIMYDMGAHYVDILRFLFGDVDSIYARTAGLSPDLIGDDRVVAMLAIDELTAILDMSWTSYSPRGGPNRYSHLVEQFRIEGDKGTLELVPHPSKGDLIRVTLADKILEYPAYFGQPFDVYKDSYRAAQQHFIDCLLSGELTETHADDNIKTLAVILAAYQSAEHNQAILIREFMEPAG
jgi:D-apiose dehydrogenase